MTTLLRTACVLPALFTIFALHAQGDFCAVFEEFCPAPNGSDLSFPAGVNSGEAEPGNNYGCLDTQPNPAWYYVQIGAPGSVTIQLFNSNNVDIDFALWGPFPDLNVAQDACGNLGFPTDCSYSIDASEIVSIPFSNTDDIYILLITNYSNDPTNINAEATGDGVPVCCRTPINQAESCPEAFDFDCGCWTTGITGTLPANNPGALIADFCGSIENQQWLRFEACWCAISLEVFAPECTNGSGLEAQLFSNCAPFEPVTDCVVIPEGESAVLTALAGDTVINCTPGAMYTLLLDGVAAADCDYIVRATAIDLPPPVLLQDTIYGPTQVCEGDTVSYQFPPFSGQGTCTATFSGDGEVISVTHGNVLVAFGEPGSGELCITISGCEGQDTYCMPVEVITCCFSEPGNLSAADWLLCPDESVSVVHQGDSSIVAPDTALYVLHDGSSNSLGNILAANSSGTFAYDPSFAFEAVYYVHYIVTRFENGQLATDICLELSGNGNTVVWYNDEPPLTANPEVFLCDDEARFYRVELTLDNGSGVYRVDGAQINGNVFTSSLIATGEAYSFAITSDNPCLDTLVVSGSYTCPCETDAGQIDDSPAELCGAETVTITPTLNPVLDDNDVLIYQLRALDGTLLMQNADGVFGYGAALDYGTVYEVRAVAGNDTGNGPLTDYPCAATSNAKTVIFYEEVSLEAPQGIEIRCNAPEPLLTVLVRGGSGSYSYRWSTPTGASLDSLRIAAADGPGAYTLMVADTRSSCSGTVAVNVVEAPIILDFRAQLIDPLCTGDDNGSIVLDSVIGGVPPFRYQLDNREEVRLPVFEFLVAGEYDLYIRDANECEFLGKITLEEPLEPQLDLGGDQVVALGEIATVTAQTNVSNPTISWRIDGQPFAAPLFSFDSLFVNNALVEAQVYDANDCTTTDRMLVLIDKESPLFIPNAFSPNGDGRNDRLTVFGNPKSVQTLFDMQIYDRWGNRVYAEETFSINEQFVGWDGLVNGQRAAVGVYVYTLGVLYIDGRTEMLSGEVLLMR